MRARRQSVSDAVSVLGMDPWKDDRVRDFVAINTIQRLRAYHLPPGAPMPPIEDINTDRALNLLLLPPAEPDYRPCAGELPPRRAEVRRRRREKERAQKQRQHSRSEKEGEGGTPEDNKGSDESLTFSESSPTSETDDSDDKEEKGQNPIELGGITAAQKDGAGYDQTPTRQPPLDRLSHSPEVSASATTPSALTQCAIDRARALFFGSASFHSSTSPRRFVNSPHVPLTPSMSSNTSPTAGRQTPQRAARTSPAAKDTTEVTGGRSTPINAAFGGMGNRENVGPCIQHSVASRSLNMDLDMYIEANSTPLRLAPPPPLQTITSSPTASAMEKKVVAVKGRDEGTQRESTSLTEIGSNVESSEKLPIPPKISPNDLEADATSGCVAASAAATSSRDAAHAAIQPTADNNDNARQDARVSIPDVKEVDNRKNDDSEEDDAPLHRSCDACEAIIQYYQSMLTRGVVLDRYNHKDLAFAWWVLGRNMDTAALENRGPMRREALLITIRNLYYSLLSADEAKVKESAGATSSGATSSSSERGDTESSVAPKLRTTTEVKQMLTSKKGEETTGGDRKATKSSVAAVTPPFSSTSRARVRGRVRHPNTSTSPNTSLQEASTLVAAHVLGKRTRGGQDAKSPQGDGETDGCQKDEDKEPLVEATLLKRQPLRQSGVITESACVLSNETRAHLKASPLPSSSVTGDAHDSTSGKGGEEEQKHEQQDSLSAPRTAKGAAEPLAAALRNEEANQDGLVDAGDNIASESTSLNTSTITSRAGSVAPEVGVAGSSGRRRRRAEDRRRAVEEMWTSTRTNRRTASAKAVEELALQATGSVMEARGGKTGGRGGARPPSKADVGDNTPAAEEAKTTAVEKENSTMLTASSENQDQCAKAMKVGKAVLTAPTAAVSKSKTKTAAALKRPRSPDSTNSSSSNSDGEGQEEVVKEAADRKTTQDAHRVSTEGNEVQELKKPRGKVCQAAGKRAIGIVGSANAAQTKVEEKNVDTRKGQGCWSDAVTAAAVAAAKAPVVKKGKQQHPSVPQKPPEKEEHRGRPRGSFKYPRPITVDGVAVAGPSSTTTADTHKAGTASIGSASGATRNGDKKREDASSATKAGSPAGVAVSISDDGKLRHHAAVTVPGTHIVSSRASFPLPRAMPLGLTAYERAVRARIQQRMGVPLPPVPAAVVSISSPPSFSIPSLADSAAPTPPETPSTVYSSYTFLLSSFGSHGQTGAAAAASGQGNAATTAPVLWYGTVTASGNHPKLGATCDASAVTAARVRGRKKKAEGGVDSAVLGPPLRHNQAALERQVKARLAREAAASTAAVTATAVVEDTNHSSMPSSSTSVTLLTAINNTSAAPTDVSAPTATNQLSVEQEKSEGEGAICADDRVNASIDGKGDNVESPSAVSTTGSYPLSSSFSNTAQAIQQSNALSSPSHAVECALESTTSNNGSNASTNLNNNNSTSVVRLSSSFPTATAPRQPPAEFSALTYAQQCLLVWTAGGLLERHALQQEAAEARRERLLARCGRMATRRMAARVAAAVGSGIGGEAEASAKQLVKSFAHTVERGEETEGEGGMHRDSDNDSEDSSHPTVSDSSANDYHETKRTHRKRKREQLHNAAKVGKGEPGSGSDSDAPSVSSSEARRKELQPLPRRVFDYWAAYRCSGNAVVSAGAAAKQDV